MSSERIPFERSFSLTDARRGVENWLVAKNLTWDIRVAGARVKAAKCFLRNREGVLVASGLGKGDEEESIVGAIFEATEHLCSRFEVLNEESLQYLSGEERQGEVAQLSIVLQSVLMADTEAKLPCLAHHSLCGAEAACDYPVALFLPAYVDGILDGSVQNPRDTFDYGRLALYSTNSGVAIGMNRTESIIHGLLESIERDTTSRFLLRAFLLRDASSLRHVEVEALPAELRRLRVDIESEANAEVRIYELSGRFAVPVFCSWIGRADDGFYPHGFGCSSCSIHAIRRSLHEAAQVFLAANALHDRNAVAEKNKHVLRTLEGLPFHQRCAMFDLGALSRTIPVASIRCLPSSFNWTASRAESYLRHITAQIELAGQGAFSASVVESTASEVAVTHNFTSDQDHFFTVLNGLPALPSSLYPLMDQATNARFAGHSGKKAAPSSRRRTSRST
jgi:ribosomal protein S12 methylthiotransferase accessory factor